MYPGTGWDLIVMALRCSFFFFFLNFSVTNIVRIRLQKKVEDDFLKDYLVVYIGNEIAERFSTYMTIDDFYLLNEHQVSCLK
jgi:hypothetical protein